MHNFDVIRLFDFARARGAQRWEILLFWAITYLLNLVLGEVQTLLPVGSKGGSPNSDTPRTVERV